jgi:hypothetical protein
VEDCISDLVKSAIAAADSQEDYEIGEIDVGELSFTPPDTEEERAWQIAIPVQTQGVSAAIYLELAVLREGDAVALVRTEDASDPFDPALRDDLLATIAARMSEASS